MIEKCVITIAQLYISVTDEVKINEQDISIGTGSLYVLTTFEVNRTFLPKAMEGLNPRGMQHLHEANARFQNIVYHIKKWCSMKC